VLEIAKTIWPSKDFPHKVFSCFCTTLVARIFIALIYLLTYFYYSTAMNSYTLVCTILYSFLISISAVIKLVYMIQWLLLLRCITVLVTCKSLVFNWRLLFLSACHTLKRHTPIVIFYCRITLETWYNGLLSPTLLLHMQRYCCWNRCVTLYSVCVI